MKLEEIALKDEYFVSRKLYPNVDFYSGIIYSALGIPRSMFTVLFAIARTAGWVAHWQEMVSDPHMRIGRPRQLYTGPTNGITVRSTSAEMPASVHVGHRPRRSRASLAAALFAAAQPRRRAPAEPPASPAERASDGAARGQILCAENPPGPSRSAARNGTAGAAVSTTRAISPSRPFGQPMSRSSRSSGRLDIAGQRDPGSPPSSTGGCSSASAAGRRVFARREKRLHLLDAMTPQRACHQHLAIAELGAPRADAPAQADGNPRHQTHRRAPRRA